MKITVIDSGQGGIAFSRSVKVDIKYLDISLYIDKEGFPYGDKDLSWLRERLIYLIDKCNTNIVIIACNTLSSLIFQYDMKFNKTVVDVITPTIYFLQSKSYQDICILATKNTIKMHIFDKLLKCNISYIDASDLISNIENRDNYLDNLERIISKINPYSDLIVLGCTHLIEIKDEFRKRIDIDVVSQDEIFVKLFQ